MKHIDAVLAMIDKVLAECEPEKLAPFTAWATLVYDAETDTLERI